MTEPEKNNGNSAHAEARHKPTGGGAEEMPASRGLWPFLRGLVQELPFWAREIVRKSLHIGVVVLALPLRWLGFWYGIGFAGVAMVWNAFGMPRYFRFTFRDDEEEAGYSRGMLSYPVVVFILMIFFPLPIAVSQWATLSFGDGFATLVGRFFGKRSLPWNREKTYVGLFAFLVMGSLGAIFFFWFTLPNIHGSSFLWQGSAILDPIGAMSFIKVVVICVVSTLAAAVFESIPFEHIDDNVAAPLAGALTKLALCYVI
jgi:dolichol kinase